MLNKLLLLKTNFIEQRAAAPGLIKSFLAYNEKKNQQINRRISLPGACLFLLLPLFLYLYSCSTEKIEPSKTDISTSDSVPDQVSFHTTVTFSDSGRIKAVLDAGMIRVFTRFGYTLIDSSAKVDFYKNGVINSTLTGERGKIYDNSKDVEVYDNVKLVSTDGSVLTTNKLYWVNLTQRIKSDQFVHIITKNDDIQGYGFEADQNLKNYVIYKVSGEVQK